jgi:hypothetical protein
MSRPSTVTLIEPVAAVLLRMTLLGFTKSRVIAAVNELTCQPVVSVRRRWLQMPDAAFVRTALAEVHIVRSLALPPSRAELL